MTNILTIKDFLVWFSNNPNASDKVLEEKLALLPTVEKETLKRIINQQAAA